MVCGQCAAALPPDNDFVTCKGVSRGFHYSCTNVRETSWRKKSVEDKALWRCSFCKAEPEGAIQQTAVTPIGLEQGAAAILTFLEIQQRKQEKEREEDQERMRREKEEDQEKMRREKEEDQERMRKEREEDRERLMEMVLRGLTWKTCLVYLDDVMVMGRS